MYFLSESDRAKIKALLGDAGRRQTRREVRPARREYHPFRIVLCKLKTGESLGSTATETALCEIMVGEPGSETEAEEITVYSGRLMAGGATIPEDSYIWAARVNGVWQVFAAACG